MTWLGQVVLLEWLVDYFLFDSFVVHFELVCTLMEKCVVMAASQGAELGDNQQGLHCTGAGLSTYILLHHSGGFVVGLLTGLRGGSGPKAGG